MVRRRTLALVQFVFAAVALYLTLRVRKLLWDHEERWRDDDSTDPPSPLSASQMALGATGQAAYLWAYDRDVGGIRSSRLRGSLVGVVRVFVGRRLHSRDEAVQYNRRVGGLVGVLAYRLRYGVLSPLPVED